MAGQGACPVCVEIQSTAAGCDQAEASLLEVATPTAPWFSFDSGQSCEDIPTAADTAVFAELMKGA